MTPRLEFDGINRTALSSLPSILDRWLPGGRREGREYVALNSTRSDTRLGSFRVNMATGRWSDFATGDAGGDPISLAAYLFALSQADAALRVAAMMGVPEYEQ